MMKNNLKYCWKNLFYKFLKEKVIRKMKMIAKR